MRGSGKKYKTRIRKEIELLRREQRNREYLNRSRMTRRMKQMSRKKNNEANANTQFN